MRTKRNGTYRLFLLLQQAVQLLANGLEELRALRSWWLAALGGAEATSAVADVRADVAQAVAQLSLADGAAAAAAAAASSSREEETGAPSKVSKSSLLGSRARTAGAALQAETNVGFQILQRMGWTEGQGLGRDNSGQLTPVAVSDKPLFEGVGLGCEAIPEKKLMQTNVQDMILAFLSDSTRDSLEFSAELDGTERKLVHLLAQKHGLTHKSRGKGESRALTVSKKGAPTAGTAATAPVGEAELEANFERVHQLNAPERRGADCLPPCAHTSAADAL